jgi:hypothetical protein
VGSARPALRPRAHLGRVDVRRGRLLRLGLGSGRRRRLALCRRLPALGRGAGCRPDAAGGAARRPCRIAHSGRRQQSARPAQAGAYFGWWNLVAKLNLALAAGLSLPLLDLVGYRPGDETAQGLAAVYCLLPLLFKTMAAALAWRWRKTLEGC